MRTQAPFPATAHLGFPNRQLQQIGERVMAASWLERTTLNGDVDSFLRHVLRRSPTEHDARVAATTVQWLGTTDGLSFLAEALRWMGARIELLPPGYDALSEFRDLP